jgi:hypothetical protein
MRRRTLIVAGVLALAVAAVVGAVLGTNARGGSSSVVTFQTVSAAQLAAAGVSLNAPTDGASAATAAVSAQAAAADALQAAPSQKVLETHFAHCVDTQMTPTLDQNCWAVSLDPGNLESNPAPGFPAQHATYLVALIDPSSGKFLEAIDGSQP